MVFKLLGKKLFWLFILMIAVLLVLFYFSNAILDPQSSTKNSLQSEVDKEPLVRIGDVNIPVELATSSEAVAKGLSDRPSLEKNKGMLFVFELPYRYRFWMPDMNFPIDIIWIENGQIADITENVSEDFDPLSPTFYLPQVPVRYVLEVNAGFVQEHGLKTGDRVELPLLK